jgi:hypothetical protein
MKWLIGVVAVIFITVLGIVLIASDSGSNSTQSKSGSSNGQTSQTANVDLVDLAQKQSSVVLTVAGEIINDEDYRAIRITITPAQRRLEVLAGYDGRVVMSQTFANSSAGYDNFMRALAKNDYTSTQDARHQDERGVCATGNRYTYDVYEASKLVHHSWSTTCSAKEGSFAGSSSSIRQLFRAQIPDYNKLTADVDI